MKLSTKTDTFFAGVEKLSGPEIQLVGPGTGKANSRQHIDQQRKCS